MTQIDPWMCPEVAPVELYHERCDPKVLKLSSEVSECKPRALGSKILMQKAAAGDREAQFSLGSLFMTEALAEDAGLSGAAGKSPKARVGLALSTILPLSIPRCVDGHLIMLFAGANPRRRRAWRFWRRRRGKGTRTL